MKYLDVIFSVLTGILLVVIFPRWNVEVIAWVAFVPLLISITGKGNTRTFLLGFISGLLANTGILYWTTVAMSVYGKIPWIVSGILLLLLAAVLSALYFGPWALGVRWCKDRGIPEPIAAPLIWTSLEFIRNYFLTGFPWENLGYSQYLNLPMIQLAEYTGVYGLSCLIMFVNASFSSILSGPLLIVLHRMSGKTRDIGEPATGGKGRMQGAWAAISVCVLIGLYIFGTHRLSRVQDHMATLPTLTVGLVQGNIDQDMKWDPAFQEETMNTYFRLSRSFTVEAVELVIWPETAVPFYFQSDPRYRSQVLHFPVEIHSNLLVGSVSYEFTGEKPKYSNSAYLISSTGTEAGRYDKLHMVPFGEYLPFPLHALYPLFDKIIGTVGDFTPGKEFLLLSLPRGSFGVLICYEIIFPELSRHMTRDGANFLVTITNDAWFGRTSAPYQHLSMATFRAVENRRFVARAANTGISGIIDMTGKIMQSTDVFVPAAMSGGIKIETDMTFYALHGDVFAWTCLILSVFILLKCLNFSRLIHTIKRYAG